MKSNLMFLPLGILSVVVACGVQPSHQYESLPGQDPGGATLYVNVDVPISLVPIEGNWITVQVFQRLSTGVLQLEAEEQTPLYQTIAALDFAGLSPGSKTIFIRHSDQSDEVLAIKSLQVHLKDKQTTVQTKLQLT